MILQTFSDTQRVYAVDESIGKGKKVKNNLGANIRGFRKNKGFTQEELAGMLGVTPQAVSRWESEAGLPDVSMVVPIAQALNVTTDMLLGYNPSDKDDYLLETVKNKIKAMHDISDARGSALKKVEYLAGEVSRNPMNFEMNLLYVQQVAELSYYIDMEGLLAENPERANALLEDGIKKGVTIIRYTDSRSLAEKAHYALAWIYIHSKDFENAREHINVLPSLENAKVREFLYSELIFFEHGFEEMKDSLTATNKKLCSVLLSQLNCMMENYAYWGEKDEALKNIEWCEHVAKAFSSIPEYTSGDMKHFWKKFNHNLMIVYEKSGEKEKANEICEEYLKTISESKEFSKEEYESIAKELRERVYLF